MIKTVNPRDHLKPITDPPVELIRVSSRGLVGEDLRRFEKRAFIFDRNLLLGSLKPGEVPIHVIALGCDEFYGPNRNGDAFTKEACRKYHSTFVKYALWYREHNHNDPKKSYGRVIDSKFNEALGRIELIVALNGTKQAAKRNGGLVADKELEALARGDDLGVSMSCFVEYDVCSGCGKKSKNQSEYCTERTCKYGGCKRNLGKTFEDGHTLRVFNPEPLFFDISYVAEPADRIAYALGQVKVATLIPAFREADSSLIKEAVFWLGRLAFLERQVKSGIKRACVSSFDFDPGSFICGPRALIKFSVVSGSMITPESFLRVFTDCTEETIQKVAKQMKPYLQNVFSNLLEKKDTVRLLKESPFICRLDEVDSDKLDISVFEKLASSKVNMCEFKFYNLEKPNHNLEKLAYEYALYQLGVVLNANSINCAQNAVLLNHS